MIDFSNIFGTQGQVFDAFFKTFAVLGSVMYLVYAVIILKQTSVMLRALEEEWGGLIRFISFMQLMLALVLVVLSIVLL